MNMLTLLLPGTAVTFAGDELGMESPILRYEDQRDPEGYLFGKDNYLKVCRDGSRVPFQWNDQENAGKRGRVEMRGVSFRYVKKKIEKMSPFHFLTHARLSTSLTRVNITRISQTIFYVLKIDF